ncbi:glycosyltransferase family 9 protein [Spirosoma rigui]|uniref:glycosyltransferase family 9 protein n=1 Tax=Spirosoma rigui TaxID=564064 RepID=UPI0009AF8081|nr:glycosyltransferase family 9 protein [Spirosoma rigui]
MNKPIKILVIRFSSIGDIVLTTPVLRCLKQQLVNVELHYCTKRKYETVLRQNPYIDSFHFLDSSIFQLINELRAERYDYIIDLHNNLRTTIIQAILGVKASCVNKLNWQKWLYVRFKLPVVPDQHIVSRYLRTVSFLSVKDDGLGLDYFIRPEDQISLTQLPATHRSSYVAYAIGGQYATKRLPVHKMIELCKKIDSPVILLGDQADRERGDSVVAAVGENNVFNGCGQFSLSQSASLVKQARFVFSHDTALMHIAAAFHKKIYSLWGNTTPQLGMYPYRTAYVVLEKEGLPCRPCSKIGSNRCPAGDFKCMNELPLAFTAEELMPDTTIVRMQVTE